MKDYCGEGVYHLHLPVVNEEDNAKYTCVAVNSAGRVVSNAELYVLEKETIRRPDMLIKLRTSSYKNLASRNSYLSVDTGSSAASSNQLRTLPAEKMTQSYPYVDSAGSPNSYDLWFDSYKQFNDNCTLKSISKGEQLNTIGSKSFIKKYIISNVDLQV